MNYKNTFYSTRVCINDFCSNIRNFSTELSFAQIFLFRLIISYNHKGKFLVKLLAAYIVVQKISLVTFPSNLEVKITVKEKKAFPAIKFKYRLFCPMGKSFQTKGFEQQKFLLKIKPFERKLKSISIAISSKSRAVH